MLKKIAFTVYPVTDVDRARAFYEKFLGPEVGANGGHEGKFWVEYDLPGGGVPSHLERDARCAERQCRGDHRLRGR